MSTTTPSESSNTNRIWCGSCGDGPFRREVVGDDRDKENIIDGYYFCMWCFNHTDAGDYDTTEERLLARAERDGVPRAYPSEKSE